MYFILISWELVRLLNILRRLLKLSATKFIAIMTLKSTYTTDLAYSQLLASLLEIYDVIQDSQRERTEEKIERKLTYLLVKETNLKERKEHAH